MSTCLFIKKEIPNSFRRNWVCLRCGYTSNSTDMDNQPIRNCNKLAWGDKVEWLLSQVGLTKEVFRIIKNQLFNIFRKNKKAPEDEGCLCDYRQKWLNKWHEKWLLFIHRLLG